MWRTEVVTTLPPPPAPPPPGGRGRVVGILVLSEKYSREKNQVVLYAEKGWWDSGGTEGLTVSLVLFDQYISGG